MRSRLVKEASVMQNSTGCSDQMMERSRRKPLPALASSSFQHILAGFCAHPLAKAMFPFSF
jgi:hypothetical protein